MSKAKTLGPVTRDRYEEIISRRVKAKLESLGSQLKGEKPLAVNRALKNLGLDKAFEAYEKATVALATVFGDSTAPYGLRECNRVSFETLVSTELVSSETSKVLRAKPSLQRIFQEIDRLKEFQAQLHERIWLAEAPEEIKAMLSEI